MNVEAAVVLFLLGWGRMQVPLRPPLMLLRFRVPGDAKAQALLSELEQNGEVVEMRDFDGKHLTVIWRPETAEKKRETMRLAKRQAGREGVRLLSAEALKESPG